MAIVKCKECGGELSTKADACPKCGAKQKRPSGCLKVVLILFLAFIALAVIAPFVTDKSTPTPSTAPAPTATHAAAVDPKQKVSPYVFDADEKKDFPKLASKLGASWSRLQPTREAAALHVAANPKCDFVEIAEASDKSTKANIVIFVDCRNGERMYVSESDLKAGSPNQTAASQRHSAPGVADRRHRESGADGLLIDASPLAKGCADVQPSRLPRPE